MKLTDIIESLERKIEGYEQEREEYQKIYDQWK